jgi:hypothetical protein
MSIPSSFDVSPSGPLESFLTSSPATGVFGSLAQSNSSSASATATALGSGGLTTSEHNVIASIAAGPSAGTAIPFNKDGAAPTTVANMQSFGWIKLVRKTDVNGQVSGVFQLTPVGKAIAKRTGGGQLSSAGAAGAKGSSSSGGGVSAATKQSITSAVAGVENLLAALGGGSSNAAAGINPLGSSSNPTSSGINLSDTSAGLNILA